MLDGVLELGVVDDRRGIDVERLVGAAIERGAVTREQADGLREDERVGLVFCAGVSTAAELTQSSGRGVGMAPVRHAVEALCGTIDVQSARGVGTRFVLRVPVDLGVGRIASFRY